MVKEKHTKEKHINVEEKHDRILLEWKAPEFISHPRSKSWFLMAGIVVLALVAYAIYTNSATMAIVFIVLAGVYILTHYQEPRTIDMKITELGIYAGDDFYSYHAIESFWIIYHPRFVRELNLKFKHKTSKIVIQLNAQDPAEVRRVLSKEIPEKEGAHESFSDVLTRVFRL